MMIQERNLIKGGAKTRRKLNITCEVEPNQHADLEAFGRKGAEKVTIMTRVFAKVVSNTKSRDEKPARFGNPKHLSIPH